MNLALCMISIYFVFLCVLTPVSGVGKFALPSLPPQPTFKAADIQYDDGGMGPLFDFSRSFVDTAIPTGIPTQLIHDLIHGNAVLDGTLIKQILLDYIGYAIAVVLGFLFVLLFPLVGCCFCCCRNVCRACCDRPKSADPKASCKRKVYGSFLFITFVFSLTGNICVYVSNERITTALDKINGSVNDNLDDFDTFLTSVENQLLQIRTNFHSTTDEITQHLDPTKFDQTISEFAVSTLTKGAVQRLQDSANAANQNLDSIRLELSSPHFTANVQALQSAGITAPTIALPTLNTNVVNDIIIGLKTKIQGLTGSLSAQLSGAKQQVSDMSTQVDSVVDGMKDTVDNVRSTDMDSIKDTVKDTMDTIQPFDQYRWIAGVSIGGIVSLILALQFFGMAFGVFSSCGQDTDDDSKGCASNSAGRMIVASIVFIFLFAWLLMLLTTLLFSVGALLERFVCQPLKDPDLKDVDTVINDMVDIRGMLQYQTDPPSLGTILSSCRRNQAIYSALQMDKMGNLVDFGALETTINNAKTDMRTKLDTVLNSLKGGSFGGVSLNPASVTNTLDSLSSSISGLDVDGIQKTISDLKTKVETLESKMKNLPSLPPAQQAMLTTNIPQLKDSLDKIQRDLVPLKQLTLSIAPMVADVKSQLATATAKIQKSNAMHQISDDYIDNTFYIVDVFYNNTKDAIYHDLGQCGPVWNLYNSIVIVSVCQYTVDALNGFWFSLGWCIFFLIPSIVFGIKLSNQYRDIPFDRRKPKWHDRNKVGHLDE